MTSHAKSASTLPRRLASGNYSVHCQDCGTTIVAPTAEDVDGASCACPPMLDRYLYLVELACMLCARVLGTATATSPTAPLLVRATLRCDHCGGRPWPSGNVSRRDITEYPAFVDNDRPRRGRPPGAPNKPRRAA
jgi:hypothetical protein